jgi:hypothetical protein
MAALNYSKNMLGNEEYHLLLARWFAEPISSTPKMETICFSETPVETQRTTRRYIPEDDTLHNHRCENLKSYMLGDICVTNILVKVM